MMDLSIDEIIENIKCVEYIRGDHCPLYIVTFSDGSQLELANDRIYTYTLLRTKGIAELISLVDIQRINFYQLTKIFPKAN